MVKVYTSVVGDLFHVGHLRLLERAKALGDYLIVGVITDKGVAEYKRKPVIPYKQRARIIKALRCVDKVLIQHHRDGSPNIKRFKPDILTRGNDSFLKEEVECIKKVGGRYKPLSYTKGISTTEIIKQIKKNEHL
jgi:rfaE bifunctional protein nucleotidyltransferase chain/domain